MLILLVFSGCVAPAPRHSTNEKNVAAEPAPVAIKLDYLSFLAPQERILTTDWFRVMAAIERATQDMGLQSSGTTNWKEGRAFPLYLSDDGEVAVLIQCIRRTTDHTWMQVTFLEGPEKDKTGRVIQRRLPRGPVLYDTFWTQLQRHL